MNERRGWVGGVGSESRGEPTGNDENTYQHPGRRGWWQREACPLRAQVSPGTAPRHRGTQGVTEKGGPSGTKTARESASAGSFSAPPLTHPSNRGGGGGGNSGEAEQAPARGVSGI